MQSSTIVHRLSAGIALTSLIASPLAGCSGASTALPAARAASLLQSDGRVVFQEWHYESILRTETSDWPHLPLYRAFARWSIEGLRRRHAHVDMGLRLVNAFAQAGLPVPAVRTYLPTVHGANSLGYAFFEDAIRDVLPAIERDGLANAFDVDVDTFAQRLERETTAAGGHIFLPLQVGAWTRAQR